MTTRENAMEAATDAAMARYDDKTALSRCESWRAHLREIVSDAIRAYLDKAVPDDVKELVERLNSEANAFERGSDETDHGTAALLREAADTISGCATT